MSTHINRLLTFAPMPERIGLFILSLLLLCACVEDPPVEMSGEANVRSRFIPADSVLQLETQREETNEVISEVSGRLDFIDSLENAGDPTDYTEEKNRLDNQLDSLQLIRDDLSSGISLLNNGNIKLDFVSALGSPGQITYENARLVYGLPLNSRTSSSTFIVAYGSFSGEATFDYEMETLYEERMVRLRGRNIDLISHTFDSVKVNCNADTCTTDEILVTFYF